MACEDPCVKVQVPGPQGERGVSPPAPTNGIDAFSFIDGGGFIVPAFGASVTIALRTPAGALWIGLNQTIYIETFGYYQATGPNDVTHVTILNLGYAGNINGNGILAFTDGARVSPGGIAGPDGAIPGGAFLVANNLSEGVPATMLTNLGLGGLSLPVSIGNGGTGQTTAANARTALGLAIGTDVQAFDAFLTSIALLGTAADKMIYTTGVDVAAETALTAFARTLLANASAAAARSTLGVLSRYGLLGSLTGADFNVVTDQAITMSSTNYRITDIVVKGASVSITTAAGGVYNGVGKPGGGVIVAAGQVYSALTASSKFLALTLGGVALTDMQTAGFVYLSLSTPQGVAATADVYVFGEDLS